MICMYVHNFHLLHEGSTGNASHHLLDVLRKQMFPPPTTTYHTTYQPFRRNSTNTLIPAVEALSFEHVPKCRMTTVQQFVVMVFSRGPPQVLQRYYYT